MALRALVLRCWLLICPQSGPAVPFSLACECGGSVRGRRQVRQQTLRCPRCGRAHFVLPYSLWPTEQQPVRVHPLRAWRMPLAARVATLAVILVAFWALLPYLTRPKPKAPQSRDVAREIRQHMSAAQRAMAEGNYHQAFQAADSAKSLPLAHPPFLDRDERLHVEQPVSPKRSAELLAQSALVRACEGGLLTQEDEWRAAFSGTLPRPERALRRPAPAGRRGSPHAEILRGAAWRRESATGSRGLARVARCASRSAAALVFSGCAVSRGAA